MTKIAFFDKCEYGSRRILVALKRRESLEWRGHELQNIEISLRANERVDIFYTFIINGIAYNYEARELFDKDVIILRKYANWQITKFPHDILQRLIDTNRAISADIIGNHLKKLINKDQQQALLDSSFAGMVLSINEPCFPELLKLCRSEGMKKCLMQALLFSGIKSGDIKSIVYALENGADVNSTMLVYTPLTTALKYNPKIQILKVLIDHKADINAQDRCGLRPFDAAIDAYNSAWEARSQPSSECVEFLLELGAEPVRYSFDSLKTNNIHYNPSQQALDIILLSAVENNRVRAARRLVSAGADPFSLSLFNTRYRSDAAACLARGKEMYQILVDDLRNKSSLISQRSSSTLYYVLYWIHHIPVQLVNFFTTLMMSTNSQSRVMALYRTFKRISIADSQHNKSLFEVYRLIAEHRILQIEFNAQKKLASNSIGRENKALEVFLNPNPLSRAALKFFPAAINSYNIYKKIVSGNFNEIEFYLYTKLLENLISGKLQSKFEFGQRDVFEVTKTQSDELIPREAFSLGLE